MRDHFRFSIWVAVVLAGALAATALLVGVPRLISDDECLRDVDIECTEAGWFLQAMDLVGSLVGVVAFRMLPIVLVIAIAIEASNVSTARRRSPRKTGSARSVGEQPGSERGRRL